ncbi:Mu transposase C-terminal domain-containing protein [Paenibacillus sp. CGMCC 1.16610]|uniref:Mu transposase C-terminal domain-containing protein n=1 Tax=Paenibacillus TaxID=44249 RepID=UPI0012F812C5|nr:Mu transposase C-terminal domain-containing protein [Paenibacillus sp. CGMCC 1.16610]MBA2939817.1 Mu transposase C-terminal domain-containing protein [Paenibacillus sp. CGMCC 1.16610]
MEKLIDLFPLEQAQVTGKGIQFKGFIYSCSIAIREQWYAKDLREIPIYFDNYDDDYILVLLKDGSLTIAYRISNSEVADQQSIENYQAMIRSIKEQLKYRKKRSWKK